MIEARLPEELDEQAALYALGTLAPDDRRVFKVRLEGNSLPLRQATTAYQTVTEALALATAPIAPRAALRERLVSRLEHEVDGERTQFQFVANEVAWTVGSVTPRISVKERLLARIEGHTDVTLDPLKGLTFVKSTEGTWQEMAPGVTAKLLFFDPASRRATALVRMAPGSSYVPHRHSEAEELYVLEGGCFCGGRELTVGDYHRAEAETEHHDTSSDEGCLLIVISSPQNEMLS